MEEVKSCSYSWNVVILTSFSESALVLEVSMLLISELKEVLRKQRYAVMQETLLSCSEHFDLIGWKMYLMDKGDGSNRESKKCLPLSYGEKLVCSKHQIPLMLNKKRKKKNPRCSWMMQCRAVPAPVRLKKKKKTDGENEPLIHTKLDGDLPHIHVCRRGRDGRCSDSSHESFFPRLYLPFYLCCFIH